ncbi:hypothetical protein OS493_012491 [Desmophyllum pertusum]|uniref:THAP-type domain-containing protein n=1 Tax=Desmophyllum pertusum TaxID=174260 RepID=A0A9X0D431_9CNID|nr:hypothetical protein OS493_012491 [Desmophyllum pertusum]
MPDRCTVYGCSNKNSTEKGISLHRIPFWGDQRPEAKKRRKKWVKFVENKRLKWTPSSSSVVCSDHFLPEDYETFYVLKVSGTKEYTPRLKKDAFGIAVYPTVYKVCQPPPQSDRTRRQDQRHTAKVTLKSTSTVTCPVTCPVTSLPAEHAQTEDIQPPEPEMPSIDPVPDEPELQVEGVVVDEGNHPKCGGCVSLTMEVRELKRRTRQLRNNWLGSRFKLNKCRQLLSSTKTPKRCECNCNVPVSEPAELEIPPTELEVEDYEMESEQEDAEITEEEPEDDYHADATDTDTTETDTDDDKDGRHVLAAVHFNSNLHREVRQRTDGSEQVKIVYPKFKNGEGTVRDVKKEPVFDYVEEIFQTTMGAIKEKKLDAAIHELKNMTPAPMNTMLEKQPRQEVLQKRDERRRMSCNDVPPTTPVSEVASRQIDPSTATRSKPHCSACKHPMKGHKQITTCPRNRPAGPSTI